MPDAYYPLLALNQSQKRSGPVLSLDGRILFDSMPKHGKLVKYSEKEIWIWGNSILLSASETIIDTLYAAVSLVKGTKEDLVRIRNRARYMDQYEASLQDLPKPDRKRARVDHLALQLTLHTGVAGFETGHHDVYCRLCDGRFIINLAHGAIDPRGEKELRLGFPETKSLVEKGLIGCPLCKSLTYPYFRW